MIVIDVETHPIARRPNYPPQPVGVAIKHKGKPGRYYAVGHPTKNNATEEQVRNILRDAYRSGQPLLFHNANFDIDVIETHFGLKPPYERVHDTLYELFLYDPHAPSLGLKESADRLLGMKPDERDGLFEWLVEHGILKKDQQKRVGENIWRIPGDVVGRYAVGDVVRTEKLHDFLYKKLDEGMRKAYDRERRLMPILLANEREGIRVDVKALERDIKLYEHAQQQADAWLRKKLKTPELNINSDEELADALDRCGIVTDWILTKTGKRSTAKKNMTVDMFHDKVVFAALGYRNRLETCLSVFMRPWLEMVHASGGRVYTHWNQVRQSHDDGTHGTRTGRLSCSPNFQNVPKDWYDKNDGFSLELFTKLQKTLHVPPLPLMRKYILPDEGGAFGHRDYNQQEPRILAHFENDKLCEQYNTDPRTDVHDFGRLLIQEYAGLKLERRPVKILILGEIYGRGLGSLAEELGIDVVQAKRIKAALHQAIPGIRKLSNEIKERAARNEPIRTWGGRLYYCEPPKMVRDKRTGQMRMMSFEYKLLNYLIQGSAADCTKEAIIRYNEIKKHGRFLVTVHDECNISAPKKAIKEELLLLRKAMESVEFDVPMITDAKVGPNWAALKAVEEKR